MIGHFEVITPLRRLIASLMGVVLMLAAVASAPAAGAAQTRLGARLGDIASKATATPSTSYDAAAQHSSASGDEHGPAAPVIRASARAAKVSSGDPFRPASNFVAAETALPKLTGSFADSFAGGTYTTQTFKAGTTFYRAEGADQGIGSFFGLTKPSTAADAEKMYNLEKWNNSADVVSTYRLTQDTTMYVGDVAGGTGQQALLPRGSGNVFQQAGQESLP